MVQLDLFAAAPESKTAAIKKNNAVKFGNPALYDPNRYAVINAADLPQARLELLKIMRSGRWFNLSHIDALSQKEHDPHQIGDILKFMGDQGIIEVGHHYYGTPEPTKPNDPDYKGFNYIYRIRGVR